MLPWQSSVDGLPKGPLALEVASSHRDEVVLSRLNIDQPPRRGAGDALLARRSLPA